MADVDSALLFLASDRASLITGEVPDLNGGALMDGFELWTRETKMTRLPSYGLDDKVVMVTGAAGGIGSEIALACAEAGADVVLTGRDIPQLNEVAAQVSAGRRVECIPFDLLDVESIGEGVVEACRRFGRIDGLAKLRWHQRVSVGVGGP